MARWPQRRDFLNHITSHQARVIVMEMGGPRAWREWRRDGNLCVASVFDWLWQGITVNGQHQEGIGQEIDQEFNLYRHHLQERKGQPNRGWSRVMYHSLTQQIVRQDLGYWSLCASLRTDGNPSMVSYPYYTKHATPGDSTQFRHIDLNVPRYLASGHGANAIQGSLSLDDKTATSCTEVLLGFHVHLGDWWAKVEARQQATNGEVHDLSAIWAAKDEAQYGPFTPVPCPRGGVRLTRPELPHGSTATLLPDGAARRTVLPWFVGVKDDNLTLDNPAGGTWRDLLQSHTEQTQPLLTPSGFTTQQYPVPERFAASLQLHSSSPVGRTLVCQTPWNDPRVEDEANAVLGMNRERAKKIVCQRVSRFGS